jgi:hypothetical protein
MEEVILFCLNLNYHQNLLKQVNLIFFSNLIKSLKILDDLLNSLLKEQPMQLIYFHVTSFVLNPERQLEFTHHAFMIHFN